MTPTSDLSTPALPPPEPVFRYFDGVQYVYADPLPIMRQILLRTGGKPNELPNRVFAVPPNTTDVAALVDSAEAAEQLCAMTRELFQMVPFDRLTNAGAKDAHCWKVWDEFAAFMSTQKKNSVILPTSSSPTANPPASTPPTSNTSASS